MTIKRCNRGGHSRCGPGRCSAFKRMREQLSVDTHRSNRPNTLLENVNCGPDGFFSKRRFSAANAA